MYNPHTIAVILIFLFQAKDGIRDADVTGVQTCALPILALESRAYPSTLQLVYDMGTDEDGKKISRRRSYTNVKSEAADQDLFDVALAIAGLQTRSEERRVGKWSWARRGSVLWLEERFAA